MTYWVSWIENKSNGKPVSMFTNEAHLTIEKAKEQLCLIRKNENVVCAWVDCVDDNCKKINTPIMECYINAFGGREIWRFKESEA